MTTYNCTPSIWCWLFHKHLWIYQPNENFYYCPKCDHSWGCEDTLYG